jgi:hypothetical protein
MAATTTAHRDSLVRQPHPHPPHPPQTISVRLILNLVNNIFRSTASEFPDSRDLRALLLRIMSCLVHKFGTLQHLIPRIIASEQAKLAQVNQRLAAEASIHESITSGGACLAGGWVPAGLEGGGVCVVICWCGVELGASGFFVVARSGPVRT